MVTPFPGVLLPFDFLDELRGMNARRKEAMAAQVIFTNACTMDEYVDDFEHFEERDELPPRTLDMQVLQIRRHEPQKPRRRRHDLLQHGGVGVVVEDELHVKVK